MTTLTAPTPGRRPCTILVALNEADATWWQFVTDPDHVYLTQGPAVSATRLQPTAVHITPDARRGDRYRQVMDLVHRQLAVMRPEQRPAINQLDEDSPEDRRCPPTHERSTRCPPKRASRSNPATTATTS